MAILALALALGAAACASCASPRQQHQQSAPSHARNGIGREAMPAAPLTQAAWSRSVDRTFADVGGGRSAEDWLRLRVARRRPGEQFAVILGIDDVVLASHFGGLHTLVPRTVRFARAAVRLGCAVFYVTGRSESQGYEQVRAILENAGVPASGFFGMPVGMTSVAAGKAATRSYLAGHFTLLISVAASAESFAGRAPAELEIRLPAFGPAGSAQH